MTAPPLPSHITASTFLPVSPSLIVWVLLPMYALLAGFPSQHLHSPQFLYVLLLNAEKVDL